MDNIGDPGGSWVQNQPPLAWQGFVYISEAGGPWSDGSEERSQSRATKAEGAEEPGNLTGKTPTASLAYMQVGDRVQIVALNCGEASSRLMGMGLIPGAVVDVISSLTTGSVIVALQDHRLGLGADMAQQIQVRPIESSVETAGRLAMTGDTQAMKADKETLAVKLRDAAIGSRLKVIGYEPTGRDYKRKLLAMGLTPGAELVLKRHAPLGDPTEIEVRGFRLSLRKAEADALMVEAVREGES